eukprot:1875289-Rhodomonas_salina.2
MSGTEMLCAFAGRRTFRTMRIFAAFSIAFALCHGGWCALTRKRGRVGLRSGARGWRSGWPSSKRPTLPSIAGTCLMLATSV